MQYSVAESQDRVEEPTQSNFPPVVTVPPPASGLGVGVVPASSVAGAALMQSFALLHDDAPAMQVRCASVDVVAHSEAQFWMAPQRAWSLAHVSAQVGAVPELLPVANAGSEEHANTMAPMMPDAVRISAAR